MIVRRAWRRQSKNRYLATAPRIATTTGTCSASIMVRMLRISACMLSKRWSMPSKRCQSAGPSKRWSKRCSRLSKRWSMRRSTPSKRWSKRCSRLSKRRSTPSKRWSKAPVHAFEALVEALLQAVEALVHAVEALVHAVEALVNAVKAPVHAFEATIQVIQAQVQMDEILFTSLFGVFKALFHAFLDIENALARGFEALVGELFHMVETFVHAPCKLAELACSDGVVGHHVPHGVVAFTRGHSFTGAGGRQQGGTLPNGPHA